MSQTKISLAAARVNKELSQIEAAALIGVHQQTLRNWESGRVKPSIEKLKKVCEVYGISQDSINI